MRKLTILLFSLLLIAILTSGCRRRVIYVQDTRQHNPPSHQHRDHDHRHHDHRHQQPVYDDYYDDGQCYEDTTAEVYVYTRPPAVRVERHRPRRPGRKFVWIAGRWHWNGHRYVWISGRWSRIRRGARSWNRGRWARRGRAWFWVRGYWR